MAVLKTRSIKWTETACLQLVEAVIKVEEEILNQTIRPSSARQTTRKLSRIAKAADKWSRITKLLPREFQGQSSSGHKCSDKFFELVMICRDKLAGKNTARSRRKMTKPVWEILKKREEFLKALSSKRPNTCFPECPNELETSVEALSFENDAEEDSERNDINEENLSQNTSGGASIKYASRSLSAERQDSESQNHIALSTPELYSRSISDPRDPGNVVKLSPRVGLQTRARTQARGEDSYCCTRRSSSDSRASGSKRKTSPSLSQTDSLEIRNANMNGLIRRLDVEFSHLWSWVQNRSIPIGRILMHEMTTSTIRSCARHREIDVHRSAQGTATGAFEMQTSLSRPIDYQIRASFQKLRTSFAEVLKKTSVELVQEVLKEDELLYTYPIQFMGQGKGSLHSKTHGRHQ